MDSTLAVTDITRPAATALVVEALFTFALAFVVLNVATSTDHPNNSFYGLAIGFTVAAVAVAVGGISGAAFNPAVALGAAEVGLIQGSTIWLYLVVELAAGAAASLAFLALNPGELTTPQPATDEAPADDSAGNATTPTAPVSLSPGDVQRPTHRTCE